MRVASDSDNSITIKLPAANDEAEGASFTYSVGVLSEFAFAVAASPCITMTIPTDTKMLRFERTLGEYKKKQVGGPLRPCACWHASAHVGRRAESYARAHPPQIGVLLHYVGPRIDD